MPAESESILTAGQLNLIGRRYGIPAGTSLLDVGCGDGNWVLQQRARGLNVQGLEERSRISGEPGEAVVIGSPASKVPGEAQSWDRVLFRGTGLFDAPEFQPELMIALANLGAALKPHGHLIVPVNANSIHDVERWKRILAVFPGLVRVRQFKTGLSAYLTLSFLFSGVHQVTVVDLSIRDQQVSRLEWHKRAREAVMRRAQSGEAA
jgi:hypothetical protein